MDESGRPQSSTGDTTRPGKDAPRPSQARPHPTPGPGRPERPDSTGRTGDGERTPPGTEGTMPPEADPGAPTAAPESGSADGSPQGEQHRPGSVPGGAATPLRGDTPSAPGNQHPSGQRRPDAESEDGAPPAESDASVPPAHSGAAVPHTDRAQPVPPDESGAAAQHTDRTQPVPPAQSNDPAPHTDRDAPLPPAQSNDPAPLTKPDEPAPPAQGNESAPPAQSNETPPSPGHPHPNPHDTHPDRAAATSGKRKGPAQPPANPRGGILMGRPFGVPVYVAPSWFLVAALITWVFGGQLDRVLPELGAARYLVSLFFAVAFYASVLVHELAHTVAALRFKLPVRRIQLQFFGGVSEIEKESETPGREFVLAFVGPLLSLVLAGVFYLGMMAVEPGTVPGVLLAGLMVSNLIVAAFNLLPGLPLDGGRMLRAVVWKITGKPMSGTIAAAWVGRALAVTVLIGLPLLTQTGALGGDAEDVGGMDTVTDALLAAILAAIIWTGAGNSLRMARLREHLPELRARTLTRRAVPVEPATSLAEALRRANESGARALVVVDPDGEPRSLVREAAIVGVPEHRRPWVPVSGLAQDLTDGMRVSAELAGEDLLDTLRATPATEYLVVENNGAIYGVLSAADVERAFVKAMARPS